MGIRDLPASNIPRRKRVAASEPKLVTPLVPMVMTPQENIMNAIHLYNVEISQLLRDYTIKFTQL